MLILFPSSLLLVLRSSLPSHLVVVELVVPQLAELPLEALLLRRRQRRKRKRKKRKNPTRIWVSVCSTRCLVENIWEDLHCWAHTFDIRSLRIGCLRLVLL